MARDHVPSVTPVQANAASALTNGTRMWPRSVDLRTAWGRRLRDVFIMHTQDLGGWEHCSAAELSLARRAAVLTVECEKLEAEFAREPATPEGLDLYSRLTNTLRRTHEALGLQRRARPVSKNEAAWAAIERAQRATRSGRGG
jgi:hypothetical protein